MSQRQDWYKRVMQIQPPSLTEQDTGPGKERAWAHSARGVRTPTGFLLPALAPACTHLSATGVFRGQTRFFYTPHINSGFVLL